MKQLILIGILFFIFFSLNLPGQNSIVEKEKTAIKAIIHTPTNKLENSYSFYEKLGFKVISKENPVIITDGKTIIEINPDRFARAGIKLVKKSWAQEVQKLKELTALINLPNGFLFYDPSGIAIYLIESDFKNLAVIKKIKELNIPITEEISTFNKEGIVDNIIIKDPGGYGFFIFSD